MTTRPDWDAYFLGIAQAVAARAECTRSKVGAVLVRDHRIVATGYNGVGPGEPSCLDGVCPRAQQDAPRDEPFDTPLGRCIAYHAEDNALTDAMVRGLLDARSPFILTMYVTREPCARCAETLALCNIEVKWDGLWKNKR